MHDDVKNLQCGEPLQYELENQRSRMSYYFYTDTTTKGTVACLE